jgi:glucose/arabinose dehydrogenase
MYRASARFLSIGLALVLGAAACAPLTALPLTPTVAGPASPTAPALPSATARLAATAVIPPATSTTPRELTGAPPPLPSVTAPATAPSASSAFPLAPASLSLIVSGLTRPVGLTHAGDDTGRLFVVEQPGLIRIVRGGQLLPDAFLDLRGLVNARANEQGLLGLAFHPQYRSNGRFFIYYTDAGGNLVTARYTVDPRNPDRADPQSGTPILQIGHPAFANHNGGSLAFGPDGYLYIGVGDGGSAGDPRGNGQNVKTLLGKLLRLDVNGDAYTAPADNPFVGQAGARPEIWAYGLRNPWRISFDRLTGDLYIADVGQNNYEEVDFQAAGSAGGANYGWSLMEGRHPYSGNPAPGLTPPVTEYSHDEGGCSITGGYVYRGARQPRWAGVYFFGDYCTGLIWGLAQSNGRWQRELLLESGHTLSSFGEDQAGELYVLDHQGGAIYQLVPAP